jgi:hypothetical protein
MLYYHNSVVVIDTSATMDHADQSGSQTKVQKRFFATAEASKGGITVVRTSCATKIQIANKNEMERNDFPYDISLCKHGDSDSSTERTGVSAICVDLYSIMFQVFNADIFEAWIALLTWAMLVLSNFLDPLLRLKSMLKLLQHFGT